MKIVFQAKANPSPNSAISKFSQVFLQGHLRRAHSTLVCTRRTGMGSVNLSLEEGTAGKREPCSLPLASWAPSSRFYHGHPWVLPPWPVLQASELPRELRAGEGRLRTRMALLPGFTWKTCPESSLGEVAGRREREALGSLPGAGPLYRTLQKCPCH